MKNIGQTAIRSLRILRPPESEQRAIADILTNLTERLERELDTATKLRDLKQGLVEDLLGGCVRVTNLLHETVA